MDPLGLKARQRRMDEAVDAASSGEAPPQSAEKPTGGQNSLSKESVAAASAAGAAPSEPPKKKGSRLADLMKSARAGVESYISAWNEGEKKK
ncbi:MAG TPA: hypothetical protein P5305_04110 [Rubrivivax sp.]|nr:hypothetical protein [Rubrivivax sp.]HRY87047.1 hypothetical protein [Rubrivivax sp.]